MNMSTLVGLLAGLAVFFSALFMTSSNFLLFLDAHAILIVVGGTVASSLICFSLPRVGGLLRIFVKRMLGKNKRDYNKLIEEIIAVSVASRKGKQALDAEAKRVSDPFLSDAAQILFWLESDVPPEELRALLECRGETHFERYMDEAEIFETIAKFPPAFGLMGTTLGMIALLQSLGKDDSKNLIGPSMAIALVATLYGIVLANMVFTPIAENLKKQSKEDLIARRMVIEGIMTIAADRPTRFVEERVKSFLLPSERIGSGSSGGGGGGMAKSA